MFRRTAKDRLYGEVPLVKEPWGWRYDPAFQPRLPKGAVRGDVSKQVFCTAHHNPKYFYLDETRTCIQCGSKFTFGAQEQKYWYEALKFNFNSLPIRCLSCRRRRRSEHALREQVARTRAERDRCPDDPLTHLALARAIVELHERTGRGNLEEAISAARRAAQSPSPPPEPLYWEGVAQLRANRPARARDCLTRFLEKEPKGRENRALIKAARSHLASDEG
jgi:hypothetical protein